jgi:hypothetical protein
METLNLGPLSGEKLWIRVRIIVFRSDHKLLSPDRLMSIFKLLQLLSYFKEFQEHLDCKL